MTKFDPDKLKRVMVCREEALDIIHGIYNNEFLHEGFDQYIKDNMAIEMFKELERNGLVKWEITNDNDVYAPRRHYKMELLVYPFRVGNPEENS